MKKSINKIISIFLLISIVISNLPLGVINAYVKPSVSVSSPSKSTVNAGGSVSYTVIYSNADNIDLSSSYVTLNGFSANVSVSGSGSTRTITLSNIQGTTGNKSIAIKAKSAENDTGYALATPNSVAFKLVNSNGNVSSTADNIKPSIAVSSPSKSSVNVGGSVSYTISFTDNIGVNKVNTASSYITLNGFTANVSVSNSSNKSVVTLSNIQGTAGNKNISIKAGAASDGAGNVTTAISSTTSFKLVSDNETNSNKDNVRPSISISSPNTTTVNNGGIVIYTVIFSDNTSIQKINLNPSHVVLNGFTANVSVSGSGNTRMVTLSNIQGTAGNKNISIKAGAASDSAGNITLATPSSVSFSLKQVVSNNTVSNNKGNNSSGINKTNSTTSTNVNITSNSSILNVGASTVLIKSTPTIVSTCNDNLSVLGDINKKVKTFATWLSSEKNNTKYVIQNNYVAKDEEITYVVDYYNGKEKAANDVKIRLTIPYNVDVLEINSDGYIKEQTIKETVIEWNKDKVQNSAKCRLYVKVQYLQNVKLEKSNNVSEQFYVTLNTEYDDKRESSYLRQLYIDTNSNKKATIGKYLSSIDNTNSIRPDDKITRAELAKLLVDSGVVELVKENTDYKKYKDADEIPGYAKDAVSSLYKTRIIEEFSDSEFKPNNPIVRDEFFKIVTKAAEYISNGKLKANESPFIYTDIVDDDDKTISDNAKYIMELIRQNIIKKEDANPDEYILRKDAVEIINALTFRGPYVEKLQVNSIKFVDVAEDSTYFYNIMGAANTYTYNYSETLLQNVLEIK